MNLRISPSKLSGSIVPPPSKSQAHRLIIAAALADGVSIIKNISFSEDIKATLRCIRTLGAEWQISDGILTVRGTGRNRIIESDLLFDCGESGSTLRFMIPVVLALFGRGRFTGRGRLLSRPLQSYFDIFNEKGINYELNNDTLSVEGSLKTGLYALRGDVSSQFFTGLLLALPLLNDDSRIISTTDLQSGDYISMTIDCQKKAGVIIEQGENLYVCRSSVYRSFNASVESDWSQAAFWYAANAMGNRIEILNMNQSSLQGDKQILEFIESMKDTGETILDVSDYPDIVPPAAAVAAFRPADSITMIEGAARLRIKESDRLSSVSEVLRALGADITENPDSLVIRSNGRIKGDCTVSSFNDHRIAMMTAVLATAADGPVTVKGAECVAKSYPDFWNEYRRLGGKTEEV
jgi:3-phosphoshikimate 1-carboxyvinyltransferase